MYLFNVISVDSHLEVWGGNISLLVLAPVHCLNVYL